MPKKSKAALYLAIVLFIVAALWTIVSIYDFLIPLDAIVLDAWFLWLTAAAPFPVMWTIFAWAIALATLGIALKGKH